MKVLEIITSLTSGGGERFVVDLSNELSRSKNCNVELLTIKDDLLNDYGFYKNELADSVKYSCLKENKFSFRTPIKIYRFIRRVNPDIVHIHLAGALNVVALSIIFNRKPLYVQTLHGRGDKQYNNKIEFFLKKFIYCNKLLKLVTIAKNNDDSFTQIFGSKSDAIIYNGRSMLISTDVESVKKEISNYKIDDRTIVITHVARFHPEKNQKLLIESFNQVVAEGFNAILLIIGNGYDSKEGKLLQEQACDKIYFLGLKKNVGDYLKNSDAFALSSLNEAMPITLIEALACGCIPLSTPVSGSVDIIQNGKNGFLSKDFSVDSYITMLKDFFKNHENIDKKELEVYFENNLSMKKCAEKYYEFFKKGLK